MAESDKGPFRIGGVRVPRGATRDIRLKVSERYTGDPVSLPVRVIRGKQPGPTVFVSAAVHGEELNGVGVIHELMLDDALHITAGTLLLIPVVNIFGFESQTRYMPDRRDLNRCFPGKATGSLTARLAHQLREEIVARCGYGIDLHTAASQRTNYPNIRGDLQVPEVRRLARAFGCELMVHGRGPEGSLRREAVKAGCAVITVEAGEPLKMEPAVLDIGIRGVRNCLMELGMLKGEPSRPSYQLRIERSLWVRAEVGGILRFHISPGEWVEEGQPIATNASVYGESQNVLLAPAAGVVLGMTTLPTVKPGEPVCQLAMPRASAERLRKILAGKQHRLYRRVRADLATSVSVSEKEVEPPGGDEEPDRT